MTQHLEKRKKLLNLSAILGNARSEFAARNPLSDTLCAHGVYLYSQVTPFHFRRRPQHSMLTEKSRELNAWTVAGPLVNSVNCTLNIYPPPISSRAPAAALVRKEKPLDAQYPQSFPARSHIRFTAPRWAFLPGNAESI